MIKQMISLLMLLFFLAGCAQAGQTPVVSPAEEDISPQPIALNNATLERIECPFDIPEFLNITGECGYLVVPENRAVIDSDPIKVAYVIYKSGSANPKPDPMLFLFTGPSPQLNFSMQFPYSLPTLLQDRDMVVVDIRGVGYAQPSFDCPELRELYYNTIEEAPNSEMVRGQWLDTQKTCYEDWKAQGYDFDQFGTADIVADLEDLRQALGYQQWNIVSTGYGSRLAYTMMRDYPNTVRSLILDTPEPLNGDIYSGQAQNTQRVIHLLFENCANDTKCGEAFPNLEQVFYQAVDQLNNQPVTVDVTDLQGGNRYKMVANGNRLIDLVAISVTYNVPTFIPELPRMIYQIKGGNYAKMAEFMGQLVSYYEPSSSGMQDRINCGERVFALSPSKVEAANQGVEPAIEVYLNEQYKTYYNTCQQVYKDMDTGDVPLTELKGRGDVPVLILQGEQNGFTSPDLARAVADGLGQATYVEIAQTGLNDWLYNASATDCVKPMITAFVNDPAAKPDLSCTSRRSPTLWITLP